jgi:hypothetical protein
MTVVAEEYVEVTVRFPRPTFWRLAEIAEGTGHKVEDLVVTQSLAALDRPTPGRKITPRQEREIRELWAADKSVAEISRKTGVTRKAISDRLDRWGLPGNRGVGQAWPVGSNGRRHAEKEAG